mmetsp:Transcript_18936/g.46905  ORF Transcript_18936/g.46905 Transcript_18936/m.46905 type:complete len:255 (-) Transcript_18936:409-1173(-)
MGWSGVFGGFGGVPSRSPGGEARFLTGVVRLSSVASVNLGAIASRLSSLTVAGEGIIEVVVAGGGSAGGLTISVFFFMPFLASILLVVAPPGGGIILLAGGGSCTGLTFDDDDPNAAVFGCSTDLSSKLAFVCFLTSTAGSSDLLLVASFSFSLMLGWRNSSNLLDASVAVVFLAAACCCCCGCPPANLWTLALISMASCSKSRCGTNSGMGGCNRLAVVVVVCLVPSFKVVAIVVGLNCNVCLASCKDGGVSV